MHAHHNHNHVSTLTQNHTGAGPARAGDQRQLAQDAAGRQPRAAAHDLALLPRKYYFVYTRICRGVCCCPPPSICVSSTIQTHAHAHTPLVGHHSTIRIHTYAHMHTYDHYDRGTSGSPASSTFSSGRTSGGRSVLWMSTPFCICIYIRSWGGVPMPTRYIHVRINEHVLPVCASARPACIDIHFHTTSLSLHPLDQHTPRNPPVADAGVHVLHALLP